MILDLILGYHHKINYQDWIMILLTVAGRMILKTISGQDYAVTTNLGTAHIRHIYLCLLSVI